LRNDHSKAEKVAKTFNDNKRFLPHGAVIDADMAKSFGLNIKYLEADDNLWQAYWRLYCAMRLGLQNTSQRLYEGQAASLLLG